MAWEPADTTPVEDEAPTAAPVATTPKPTGGGFEPIAPIPEDVTPDALADDPEFEPLAAARARRKALEAETTALVAQNPDQREAAMRAFDVQLGQDPVYNLFTEAHKKRVAKLAGDKNYDPKSHYAESKDFPMRGAEVELGGNKFDALEFLTAQRDTAADVYAYRARNPDKNTDWGKVKHGVKEQAKDAFGLAGALRGTGYLLDDAAYMARGAVGALTGNPAEIAKGDLAAREVQSGVLSGALSLINLGHGLADWWAGDDVKGLGDTELRAKLEDEVLRKIETPEKLKVQNLAPVGGGQPYAATAAEAGELPKADLDFLRFGQPLDAEGKPLPKPSAQEQRAGDIATRAEFSAYGALMGLPGYSHVVKALTGGAAKAGGKVTQGAGRIAAQLINSRIGRGATLMGAGASALAGGPAGGLATYGAARLAAAAARLAERGGAGVARLGDEILQGKPLTGGTRVGRTVAEGAKAGALSTVGATPFVLAAETPEDAISTAIGLGLQGGVGKFAKEALTGNMRNQGTGQQLATIGAQLKTGAHDDAHAAATAGLKPGERDTVNAIRGLMSRFKDAEGNPLELHAVDGQTFEQVVRQNYPGASDAAIAEAARARGFATEGNKVFVNAGAGGAGGTAAHEGGHLAMRAMAAMDAHMRDSAKAAIAEALYQPGGQPVPEFAAFIEGYNKQAPKAGQIDMRKPEGWVRAEDEFIAEHFRNLTTGKRPALQAVGALATGDSLANRLGAAYANWAKANGIRPPDKLSEFNWAEVPEFTKRFGAVLNQAFKDAHKKGAPDPSAAAVARKNAERMAQIDQLPPGELTPQIINEYDTLRKQNAEIGRKLAQIGQKAPETPPAQETPAVTPAAPTTPAQAPETANNAARADAQAALVKLGVPTKEAKDLAAAATGADSGAILADALARRTKARQPAPALAAVTPTTTATAPKPALATMGATTPTRPALAPEPATSHGAKSRAPEPTADDAAAEALIAEAAKGGPRMPAVLEVVTQAAAGRPDLLQKRTNPLTGKESYAGRLDLSLPEHRAFVRELGLPEAEAAKLKEASNAAAAGETKYVDYWSASKEDAADITGKQRAKELAADKAKRSRELLQKDKAILFTGVEAWPSGKAVQKGISIDKFVANAAKLMDAAKGHKLDVGYEGINDPALIADLQGYVANHRAGYKGDGSGPVKGKTPTEGYEPYLIPRNRFDLLNAAFNIDISTAKSQHAAKVAADVATKAAGGKVRKRPALRPETELKAEEAQLDAMENGWQVDDATGDTNPFRALINREGKLVYQNAKGEARKGTQEVLESVFENLSPDMIDAIRDQPAGERSIVREVGFTGDAGAVLKKGTPDWRNVAAGFMPGETFMGKTAAEWEADMRANKVVPNEVWEKYPDAAARASEARRTERGDSATPSKSRTEELTDFIRGMVDAGEISKTDAKDTGAIYDALKSQFGKDEAERRYKEVHAAINNKGGMFMPGEGTPRIVGTAIKIKDGEFVRGKKTNTPHSELTKEAIEKGWDMEDAGRGFMVRDPDGTERWVDRKEAYDIAGKSGQRATENTKGELNSQDIAEAPSIQTGRPAIDAAIAKFNRGEITRAQMADIIRENSEYFMPNEDPRAIKEAAVKRKDGKVFTGQIHALAAEKAYGRVFTTAADEATEGFVTNDGEFLGRREAHARARELKQIGEKYQSTEPPTRAGALESVTFERYRDDKNRFMPGEKPKEFYSQLERVARDKIKGRATPEQITATLRNNGVKQEELDWVLGDYLRGKAGQKIDPQELQEQIAANAVELKEKQLGKTSAPWTENERVEIYNAVADRSPQTLEALRSAAYEKQWEDVSSILSKAGLKEEADKISAWHNTETGFTKFHQYQLPGGTNYRELLFTLPSKPIPQKWSPFKKDEKYWGIKSDAGHEDVAWFANEAEAIAFAEKANQNTPSYRETNTEFKSSHYPEDPNIIFHARVNERKTADGRDILFAEEMQSDLHQAGRKKGYKTDVPYDKARHDELADIQKTRKLTDAEISEVQRLNSARNANSPGADLVPNLPFKGEGWKRLAIKKLLAEAVRGGKAAIGWTTGEQQAARYDLSKQVDEVVYYPETKDIQAFKDGKELIFKKGVEPKDLPEIIGKEAADKLLNNPTEKTPAKGGGFNHTIKGADLKVGGEGMKGFYDKELVNIANDIGKRYGARVEKARIGGAKKDVTEAEKEVARRYVDENVEFSKRGRDIWYAHYPEDMGGERIGPFGSEAEARREAEDYYQVMREYERDDAPEKETKNESHDVWVLPITPQLKAAIEGGQALFMPGGTKPVVVGGTPLNVGRDPVTGQFTPLQKEEEKRGKKPALADFK